MAKPYNGVLGHLFVTSRSKDCTYMKGGKGCTLQDPNQGNQQPQTWGYTSPDV